MMVRAAVACAVGLGLGVAAPVRAQPRDALTWRAPGACPGAGDVRARIERRLGAPVAVADRGVAVDVVDRGEGGAPRFVARIVLSGPRGAGPRGADAAAGEDVRVLSSARCDELADAVAVVIARLAAELRPVAGPSEPRLERPGEVQALPAPADRGAALRVLGISGIGAQPGVSVGGEFAGTVRMRAAIVELAGVRWLSSSRVSHAGAPGRIDVDLRLAALRLGWAPRSCRSGRGSPGSSACSAEARPGAPGPGWEPRAGWPRAAGSPWPGR